MEFWEFLIQKEGDRSWLPLESADVEVLEGRYRVVARSSRANTPVEIRITQDAIAEDPPKRRVQKRTSRTNPEGLLVVMPFTRLQPGIWELRCTSDVMADMLGEVWQHTVKLQVVSQDVETPGDWDDSDWLAGAPDFVAAEEPQAQKQLLNGDRPMAAQAEAPPAGPPTFVDTAAGAPLAAREANEPVADARLTRESTDTSADKQPPCSPAEEPDTWRLHVSSDAYSVQRGETLTLRGEIQIPAGHTAPVYLQVRLWDPQTAEVLHDGVDPVPTAAPQTDFCCTVAVPSDCQTRLMLGELRLIERQEQSASSQPALAISTFAVTVNLDELLEAIADSYPESRGVHPPLEFADTAEVFPLSLEFLELINQPHAELTTTPVADRPLPPQLYQPDPTSPRTRIELPSVPIPDAPSVAPAAPVEAVSSGDEFDIPVADRQTACVPAIAADETGDPAAGLPIAAAVASSADEPLEPEAAARLSQPPTERAPEPLLFAPELESFRQLNLSNRFWSKLQSFVTRPLDPDSALSETVHSADSSLPLARPLDRVQDEVVVDDEPDNELLVEVQRSRSLRPPDVPSPQEPRLGDDEAVPIPHLEIRDTELVSGQFVAIVVTLPVVEARLSVKLWFYDRQSRTVLEGPRWLVDFMPTGLGEQQSRVQLPVPYGCTHVHIEAIAVEMATQRESHKVSVERSVVPPDLPALLLDDLGL